MGKLQELLGKLQNIQKQAEESNKMNTENPVPVDSSKAADGSSGRLQSRVKQFRVKSAFGFLRTDSDPRDIFLYINDVVDESKPKPGDLYECELVEEDVKGKKQKGLRALNVKRIEEATWTPTPVPKENRGDLLKWALVPKLFTSKCEALISLSELAQDESWEYRENNSDTIDKYGVLRSYFQYTFTWLDKKRLEYEQKIVETDSQGKVDGGDSSLEYEQKIVEILERDNKPYQLATFNTGLVDDSYKPIYALFERNDQPSPFWRWRSFCVSGQGKEGQLLHEAFDKLPAAASYFDNIYDIHFDPDAKFQYDEGHIIIDGIKNDRYPHAFIEKYGGGFCRKRYEKAKKEGGKNDYLEEVAQRLKPKPPEYIEFLNRLENAIELARKRARWNYRTAVPQYYPRDNEMSFLLPLALMDDTKIDAALVVKIIRDGADKTLGHKGGLRYQGKTIFPLSYAYRNARLVAKPISDWLNPEKILEQ